MRRHCIRHRDESPPGGRVLLLPFAASAAAGGAPRLKLPLPRRSLWPMLLDDGLRPTLSASLMDMPLPLPPTRGALLGAPLLDFSDADWCRGRGRAAGASTREPTRQPQKSSSASSESVD